MTNNSLGELHSTISADGTEIYCDEIVTTFVLGDESIVADENCIYIYRDDLGGYEVKGIDNTQSSFIELKTGINGYLTIAIAQEAFDGCSNLANITIPESVTIISHAAFSGTSLTNITIPKNVVSIDLWVFSGCVNLENITFEGTVEQWNAVSKGEGWNSNTPVTEVVCSDGVVPLN